MKIRKSYLIPLFILVLLTWTTAQEHKIVVHKQIVNGDSLNQEIIINGEGMIEWHGGIDIEDIMLDGEYLHGDSLGHKIIFSHSGDFELLGDSSIKRMRIKRVPHHRTQPARVIIKKSGFFRKSKIIIDFDPMTQEILQVIDNDDKVPAKKFHKYQDYLEGATEYADWEALHPRMEALDLNLEMLSLADSEKLADLETLIIDLEGLESERAHFKKEHYTSIKRVIELDNIADAIQNIFSENGQTPPQKIKEISIKNRKFYLNGEEIKGELGQQCIQVYLGQSDLTPEDLEKKGDEISIEIRLD